MSKKCEICGTLVDELDAIMLEGVPKVCQGCANKYVKLKNGEISADEMITDYTPVNLANVLREKEIRINRAPEKDEKIDQNVVCDDSEEQDGGSVLIKIVVSICIILAITFLLIFGSRLILGYFLFKIFVDIFDN